MGSRVRAGGIVLIEVRRNDDGTLDEVVAKDCSFHLEQMSEDCWWMAVYKENRRVAVFLSTKHGAHIVAAVEDELEEVREECPGRD